MLAVVLSLSVPVAAAENGSIKTSYKYVNEDKSVFCDEEAVSYADLDTDGNAQITKMKENVSITELERILSNSNANPKSGSNMASALSTSGLSADAYEPNDTVATAYNYDKIPEMNHHFFANGFKSANLHTVDDEDWYYTTLTAGETYFLDLRNIGSTRGFNISIFYFNDDNTFDYLTSVGDERFVDNPEKYYYIKMNKSGRYYVCITGDGINTSLMNYFFYIGDVERTFTYTAPAGGIQVFGSTFQTGKKLDLTNLVPKNSEILSMSLSNDFSGKTCTECQKKIVAADGRAYYSSNSGGTDILNISGKQKLDQVWSISARCTSNTHVTNWTPTITARYKCFMQPYPGIL